MKSLMLLDGRGALRAFAVLGSAGVLAVAGCASSPDIASEKPEPGQKLSPAQVRNVVVDSPFLVSGDFFRNRSREDDVDFGKAELRSKELEKTQQDYGQRIARLEEQTAGANKPAAGGQLPVQAGRPRLKLGFLFGTALTEQAGDQLRMALNKLTPALPVVLVSEDEVSESMAKSACKTQDIACTSLALGTYPGVRMLGVVESFVLPPRLPGQATARISLVDTGLSYRYPPLDLKAEITDAAGARNFAEQVLNRASQWAVDKGDTMPWYTRNFSQQPGKWYISAGKLSGLSVGDVLEVTTKGEIVNAPSGIPAGWVPGVHKGKLKVSALFSKDLAVCTLLEGTGPEIGDLIVMPGAN